MKNDPYERAEEALVDAYNNGELTNSEFNAEMRDLRDSLRQEAEEAAEAAYNDVMGSW